MGITTWVSVFIPSRVIRREPLKTDADLSGCFLGHVLSPGICFSDPGLFFSSIGTRSEQTTHETRLLGISDTFPRSHALSTDMANEGFEICASVDSESRAIAPFTALLETIPR